MELQASASTGLDEVGNDRLERGEGGSEEGEDKTPHGEVVVSVGTVSSRKREGQSRREREGRGGARTDAKPTPAMTGRSERTFIPLNLARRKMTEMSMVKRGVAARTTWWN